jgi:uncharacterized protein YukE
MHAGATAVREAQQAITEHIGALRVEVDRMTGDRRGDASPAFMKIHNSFEVSANRITSALARMHDALGATHHTGEVQEPDPGQTFGT